MRAFLVAGSPEALRPQGLDPGPEDYVIAVDSGLLHARDWDWDVQLLIGDLDSLPHAVETDWSAAAPEVITAPTAKDETDLELALAEALRRGADSIVFCAVLGGRADHMLANVFLLARPELAGLDVLIAEGRQTLRLLSGGQTAAFAGAEGDLLSLLPVAGPATGVVTQGLLYPLHDETLALGQARGISNVFAAREASVSLRVGKLLVFHESAAAKLLGEQSTSPE